VSDQEVSLAPVQIDDAAVLAALYSAERDFLGPFEPTRDASFFTVAAHRQIIDRSIALRVAGFGERFLIRVGDEVVGVLAVNNIVRGVFQSASIGYFVAQAHNGHGVATRAVAQVCEWAFGPAKLHRLEAGTLVDNIASQRVLERNGFRRIGLAPRYLQIAGQWQDHVLFQRLSDVEV
jgi:[ribosomal protein S5]-alanine N-acetyltransferase